MIKKSAITFASLLMMSFLQVTTSNATAITVAATANIYDAGLTTPSGGGILPIEIPLSGDEGYITFRATGSITLNGGGNYNNADGGGANRSTSYNSGTSSISGITGPGAGYLVGVFLGEGGSAGTLPSALNFLSSGIGTAFSSLSPLVDQTFFIGDGLTGTGTGATQVFYVPAGTTALYLGISDAGNYSGAPGAYADNRGNYTVTYSYTDTAIIAEPASFGLLALGLLVMGGMIIRRRPTGHLAI